MRADLESEASHHKCKCHKCCGFHTHLDGSEAIWQKNGAIGRVQFDKVVKGKTTEEDS